MTSQTEQTHYDILEIIPSASTHEVERAYRRLADEQHPDQHGGTAESTAAFWRINEAYQALKDVRSRAKYDRENGIRRSHVPESTGPSRTDIRHQSSEDLGPETAEVVELQEVSRKLELHATRSKELEDDVDELRRQINEAYDFADGIQGEIERLEEEVVEDDEPPEIEQGARGRSWWDWSWLFAETEEERVRRERRERVEREEMLKAKMAELEETYEDLDEMETQVVAVEKEIAVEKKAYGEILARKIEIRQARRKRVMEEVVSLPPRPRSGRKRERSPDLIRGAGGSGKRRKRTHLARVDDLRRELYGNGRYEDVLSSAYSWSRRDSSSSWPSDGSMTAKWNGSPGRRMKD
ncbi:hypothetical protein PRZ48_013244 [Zasmidium cellare]|uniref:J domain-containing protein n=1 Tax=Zasmidium cellare TaxID=395010 RepID=A0ABR0E3I5_ZASCE|nr:hypothetical protein PRZ48_013244 [Zasmidium cellare]